MMVLLFLVDRSPPELVVPAVNLLDLRRIAVVWAGKDE
jgi:hypothetical protein